MTKSKMLEKDSVGSLCFSSCIYRYLGLKKHLEW